MLKINMLPHSMFKYIYWKENDAEIFKSNNDKSGRMLPKTENKKQWNHKDRILSQIY